MLTKRETEVLRLSCDGKHMKTIAHELGISVKTVATFRQRLGIKTGCRTSAQLGVWAVRNGVV